MRNREKEGKGDTQMKTVVSTKQCKQKIFTHKVRDSLFPDPPPKKKGESCVGGVQPHTMG